MRQSVRGRGDAGDEGCENDSQGECRSMTATEREGTLSHMYHLPFGSRADEEEGIV